MRILIVWLAGVPLLVGVSALALAWLIPAYADRKSLAYIRESKNSIIDLATMTPREWDRACVLGPYSRDATAEALLGFNWSIEKHSAIELSDAISLIVFVKAGKVVRDIDVPRNVADFSGLSGRCFPRHSARFLTEPRSPGNWPEMVRVDAAEP